MHYMAHRLRLCQNTPRPCFLPCKRWPVFSFSASLTRTQHDGAHPQAQPLPSRPRPDVQQPVRLEKGPQSLPQSPPQYTRLNPNGNLVGSAREVPQQSSQTPAADARNATESSLPFTCDGCGSKFRTQQSLDHHHRLNTLKEGSGGQAGGCKTLHSTSVAGMKVGSTIPKTGRVVCPRSPMLLTQYLTRGMLQVNPHVLKFQDPRDLRHTVGLGGKILEISSRQLEPSTVAVSEDSGYQVVSTFNAMPENTSPVSVSGQSHVAPWLHRVIRLLLFSLQPKLMRTVSLKGSPPLWKNQKSPINLLPLERSAPPDQGSDAFNLLMLSAQHTSSDFRHDQVDIVTNTAILNRLLKICKGEPIGTYRFSLRMIQGSLFLAHDSSFGLPGHTHRSLLRSALMKRCTEFPPGLEHSTHYRSVQYSLGHLNCVVQSKVDALCSILPGELQPPSSPSPVRSEVSQAYPLHSEVAVISVSVSERRPKILQAEAFWLSRIPFLLTAWVRPDGKLKKVFKIDTTSAAREWEKEETQQLALRRLATLLSDLKRAVKAAAPDGQACIGLTERHLDPPMLHVFLSEDKSAVPGDISNN